jgi:HEPN domain-containing protein
VTLPTGQWYDKSGKDLDMVRRALEPDPDANLEGAAFHIQQAAEKLVKGYLTQIGVVVPRTHDIGALAAQVPAGDPFKAQFMALDAVTPWATLWRYPPDDPATNLAPDIGDVLTWKRKVEELSNSIRPGRSAGCP